ncbi:uncharacterized protein LOC100182280 [Ciona intestinalis]
MKLLVVCMLLGWLCTSYADVGPTVELLKRAYCACVCCEEKGACYKDSSIPAEYECESNSCTEDFCVKWGQARCKTSCFCAKCKSSLHPTDNRCINYDSVLQGCTCPSPEVITCPDPGIAPGEIPEPQEIKEAKKVLETLKENAHCIVPCFCSKCKDSIPPHFQQKCSSTGLPGPECDCKNITCPTTDEIQRFEQMAEEASNVDLDEEMKKLDEMKKEAAQMQKETDEINEKLKDEIAAGTTKAISPAQLKTTKCNLQCICDKCRSGSVSLAENCVKIVPHKIEMCPPCPDDIKCPAVDNEASCKMHCFCIHCKEDDRMPDRLRNECDRVMRHSSDVCTECPDDVDCSTLDQLVAPESSGETHKEPKVGKIKEKHRMWDEL